MMNASTHNLEPLLHALEFEPKDMALMVQALTHRSFFNELPTLCTGYNEKLEFIGDAVLDLAVGHLLMEQFPQDNEGGLSKKRASMVNEEYLADRGRHLRLQNYLRLGRGETRTGSQNQRLLASAFEAVIGAIYLDAGYPQVYKVVEKLFSNGIFNLTGQIDFSADYKTRLQEVTQQLYQQIPSYQLIEATGPDHERSFHVSVSLSTGVVAYGVGRSKKYAENEAARLALEIIDGK